MSYSKNGFLATGTGGGAGTSMVTNLSPGQISAPITGSTWTLGGVANYPDASNLNLTTAATSVSGWAWYPSSVALDGLYLSMDLTVGVDALQIILADPALDTTASSPQGANNHGISIGFWSWYNNPRPAPDAGSLGGYANIAWQGAANTITSTVAAHVVDSTLTQSVNGATYGPFRCEVMVRATGATGLYHYQVFKNGASYLDVILPGPVGGRVLLGFLGITGGSYSVNKVAKFTGFQGLYESQPIASADAYGMFTSPSLTRPQGTLARRYTFDSTNEGFVNDVGTMSVVSNRLQLASSGNNNMSALEPSGASAIADGEFWADIYPVTPDSSGQYDYGLLFRATDANNHYLLALRQGTTGSSSSEFEVYKKVAGTYTSIRGTVGVTTYNNPMALSGTTPARVMVRFVGSQISVYCNEVFVLGVSDTTFTTGRCGVRTAGSTNGVTAQFDNMSVYTLASTWTPLPYTPQTALAAPQYQMPTKAQINYVEVTSTANGSLTNQTWSTINNLDSIVSDPNGLYNTTTKQYTVPVSGTYQITMVFRCDAALGTNVGFAVHTSNADSAFTIWRQDSAGGGGRHSFNYTRVGQFVAGDQLRAFAYVDTTGTTVIQGSFLSIQQIATSGTVASAAALPETVSSANSGTSYTFPDPTIASIANVTMTGNAVFTMPTAGAGKSFTAALTQDTTGGRTATWPSTIKWPSGTTPLLSTGVGKTDLLTFVCIDGTNWLGALAGRY